MSHEPKTCRGCGRAIGEVRGGSAPRYCTSACRERLQAELLEDFFRQQTPAEEIARRSAEIRRGWTPWQERQRRGAVERPYEVPVVAIVDTGLAFRAED